MRILQLSTQTTLVPDRGGQLRSHHIGRVLEQQGFDVQRLAVCLHTPGDVYDPREPIIDVASMSFWDSKEFESYGPCRDLLTDYLATVGALKSARILRDFDKHVGEAAPDVVLLEHPWTWPLLARLDEVRSGAIRVIYSSQNVEVDSKRQFLEEVGITPPPELLEGIDALERSLVVNAVGVCACTRADAATFASWGARRVVLVPNGGVRRERGHLLDILPEPLLPAYSYALAVGSDYHPNVAGFLSLVGPSLPLLRPHQRIVVAGSAAAKIVEALEQTCRGHLTQGRLISLGMVDDFCLDCLIANAHVLLLPTQHGGGSNVKTAEALLSGRPIVATEMAMRGFDRFRKLDALTVANDAAQFGKSMLALLEAPFRKLTDDLPVLSSLLWETTIAPLIELMRQIEAEVDRRPEPSSGGRVSRAKQTA